MIGLRLRLKLGLRLGLELRLHWDGGSFIHSFPSSLGSYLPKTPYLKN